MCNGQQNPNGPMATHTDPDQPPNRFARFVEKATRSAFRHFFSAGAGGRSREE